MIQEGVSKAVLLSRSAVDRVLASDKLIELARRLRTPVMNVSQLPGTTVLFLFAVFVPFFSAALYSGGQFGGKLLAMGFVYYITLILGFFSAYEALTRLLLEEEALEEVSRKSLELTHPHVPSGELEARRSVELNLDHQEGWNSFLPFKEINEQRGQLASVRMVKRVWLQAGEMRYEPIGIVADSYSNELHEGTRSMRSWQTIGIRLGILGTFVGLMLILGDLAHGLPTAQKTPLVSADPSQLFSLVQSITNKLSFSFGTSVAGLAVAVVLQLELLLIRWREDAVARKFEAAVRDLQHVCSQGALRRGLFQSVQALNATIDKHAKQWTSHRDTFSDEIAKVEQLAEQQSSVIRERYNEWKQIIEESLRLKDALVKSVKSFEEYRQGMDTALRDHVNTTRSALEQWFNSMLASVGALKSQTEKQTAADVSDTLIKIERILTRLERRDRWRWLKTMLMVSFVLCVGMLLLIIGYAAARPDLLRH